MRAPKGASAPLATGCSLFATRYSLLAQRERFPEEFPERGLDHPFGLVEEGLIRLPPLQDIVIQVDDLLVTVHQTVAEARERVDNPGHPGGDPKLGVDFTGDGSFVVEQAAPLIVKNPEHAGGRDLGGRTGEIIPFPDQRFNQLPRVATDQPRGTDTPT